MKLFNLSLFQKLSTNNTPNVSEELSHINREMYKKSFELNERNKTLSLLRKLDEIALSSVTDPQEIGNQVVQLLIKETDFKLVAISLINQSDDSLERISIAESADMAQKIQSITPQISHIANIRLQLEQNIIVQTIKSKKMKLTNNLEDILLYNLDSKVIKEIQIQSGIVTILIFPLIIRQEAIGTMTIGLNEEYTAVSEYTHDLLSRLVSIIGIAMDSSLLYNEVQKSNEQLKALDKMKDEFVSLASHELRTPMTAIKSYIWMALDGRGGPLTEKQKYYIDRAYKSTDRLISLVNEMLNISRIESGRITLEMCVVKPDDLVKEVLDEVMPRAQELQLTLQVLPHSDLPEILVDSDKIKEVLINIIGNSFKFTPAHGTITISFVKTDTMVEIQVTDTGIGIAPENTGKLFQKFSMLAESYASNPSVQGTGLGLYISKSIIELHRGKIWVHSEGMNKGATFGFSIPIPMQQEKEAVLQQKINTSQIKLGLVHTHI